MKNTKNIKPPDTVLYLPRELFNSLVSALDYFIASEREVGATVQSEQATRLKQKILTHARAFGKDDGDNNPCEGNASIYFYGVEAAVVMKLLTIYINLGEEPKADYFGQIKKRGKKNAG